MLMSQEFLFRDLDVTEKNFVHSVNFSLSVLELYFTLVEVAVLELVLNSHLS